MSRVYPVSSDAKARALLDESAYDKLYAHSVNDN